MHRVSLNRLVIMIFPITIAILGAYLALNNNHYDFKFLRACQLLYKFMAVLSVAKFSDSPLKKLEDGFINLTWSLSMNSPLNFRLFAAILITLYPLISKYIPTYLHCTHAYPPYHRKCLNKHTLNDYVLAKYTFLSPCSISIFVSYSRVVGKL